MGKRHLLTGSQTPSGVWHHVLDAHCGSTTTCSWKKSQNHNMTPKPHPSTRESYNRGQYYKKLIPPESKLDLNTSTGGSDNL